MPVHTKMPYMRRSISSWTNVGTPVSLKIEDSQYYESIALQAIGFDDNLVLTVEGSINGATYAALDTTVFFLPANNITCGAATKIIMVKLGGAYPGGLRVTSAGNSELAGSIAASMSNNQYNTASRGGE